MSHALCEYLYLATDGDLYKIGIAKDAYVRCYHMRSPSGAKVSLIDHWHRPGLAAEMETSIKGILAYCRVPGRKEWFDITLKEIRFEVERVIRVLDSYYARLRSTGNSR